MGYYYHFWYGSISKYAATDNSLVNLYRRTATPCGVLPRTSTPSPSSSGSSPPPTSTESSGSSLSGPVSCITLTPSVLSSSPSSRSSDSSTTTPPPSTLTRASPSPT